MPRRLRQNANTEFFHIMTHGISQEYIFNNYKLKNKYIFELKKYLKKYNVTLMCYCIMDNHSHLLIKSSKLSEISEYMRSVNTTYAMFYNKINNRKGYVFRSRFNLQPICSEKQLYNCINYIFNNPVKARICDSQEKYLFSNYLEFFQNNKNIPNEMNKDIEEEIEKEFEFEKTKSHFNKQQIKIKYNVKDALSENARKKLILKLRKEEGLTYLQISKIIGRSQSTIYRIVKEKIDNNITIDKM